MARPSIREPIQPIFQAWADLNAAVDAHLAGNIAKADYHFRQADNRDVWHWVNPAWEKPHLNVIDFNPVGDTVKLEKSRRHPVREFPPDIKAQLLARDGHRCRYCGIPVVSADIRKLAHRLYPDAVPWDDVSTDRQHAAFQCFWLQFDHVVPHCHGGQSTLENGVISCGLCNYGKDQYTLLQLDVEDPRMRPPVACEWNGLERFRSVELTLPRLSRRSTSKTPSSDAALAPAAILPPKVPSRSIGEIWDFFLPGAQVSKGYLYTPEINGKQRWFTLSDRVVAKPAIRYGIPGQRVTCDPDEFHRRGIPPEDYDDRHWDLRHPSQA